MNIVTPNYSTDDVLKISLRDIAQSNLLILRNRSTNQYYFTSVFNILSVENLYEITIDGVFKERINLIEGQFMDIEIYSLTSIFPVEYNKLVYRGTFLCTAQQIGNNVKDSYSINKEPVEYTEHKSSNEYLII